MAHHNTHQPPTPQERLTRTATTFSLISALLGGWLYVKPRTRGLTTAMVGYGLKILGGALSPVIALLGLVGAMLSRRVGRPVVAMLGGLGAFLAGDYVRRVTAPHDGFDRAFGAKWRTRLEETGHVSRPAVLPQSVGAAAAADASLVLVGAPESELCDPELTPEPEPVRTPLRLPYRALVWRPPYLTWRWALGQVAKRPKPLVLRDFAFDTVPGTHRSLLCDLWLPAAGVPRSSVGVIYLHGGSWQAFDKGVATGPLHRHLAVQGHVVMDVAYRMTRETDMRGMVDDVKRAIVWMKENAACLGIDPTRVVISGASAGGHLALLAAYTPNDPAFAPPDIGAADTSVRGVVAYYPVADLRSLGRLWSEQAMHPVATAVGKMFGYFPEEGYLPWSRLVERLFEVPPGEADEALLTYSPVAHVGSQCPPTLLIQGLHDHVVPVADTQALHRALVAAGRQSVLLELPQVEHAFDMIGLEISPPAQAALYDVERFLALMA